MKKKLILFLYVFIISNFFIVAQLAIQEPNFYILNKNIYSIDDCKNTIFLKENLKKWDGWAWHFSDSSYQPIFQNENFESVLYQVAMVIFLEDVELKKLVKENISKIAKKNAIIFDSWPEKEVRYKTYYFFMDEKFAQNFNDEFKQNFNDDIDRFHWRKIVIKKQEDAKKNIFCGYTTRNSEKPILNCPLENLFKEKIKSDFSTCLSNPKLLRLVTYSDIQRDIQNLEQIIAFLKDSKNKDIILNWENIEEKKKENIKNEWKEKYQSNIYVFTKLQPSVENWDWDTIINDYNNCLVYFNDRMQRLSIINQDFSENSKYFDVSLNNIQCIWFPYSFFIRKPNQ